MNHLTVNGIPYVFLVDFERKKPLIFTIEQARKHGFYIDFHTAASHRNTSIASGKFPLRFSPVPYPRYHKAFSLVHEHIRNGDTYLLNLTFPTPVNTPFSLREIFLRANAPYKLLYRDSFVCFSPEIFIRTSGNRISSYPMKGTIDASIPGAEKRLLDDPKETYEHNTIVDLIRNDLSTVATRVKVEKYRYTDRISSLQGDILQASSVISGELPQDWRKNAGTWFWKLLPAGSVSGAPKAKTLEIIRRAETGKRGYYSGVFGRFDGENIDSAVAIRYIEKKSGKMYYRSGGGITFLSEPKEEYHELIRKIYLPFV